MVQNRFSYKAHFFVIVFRNCQQYASLFFIVGVDNSGQENELGILELIHCLVETLDKYFQVSFVFTAALCFRCISFLFDSKIMDDLFVVYLPTLSIIIQTVCELDIMHNLDKTHFILNEVVMNGTIVDANRENVLNLRSLEDKHSNVLTRGA